MGHGGADGCVCVARATRVQQLHIIFAKSILDMHRKNPPNYPGTSGRQARGWCGRREGPAPPCARLSHGGQLHCNRCLLHHAHAAFSVVCQLHLLSPKHSDCRRDSITINRQQPPLPSLRKLHWRALRLDAPASIETEMQENVRALCNDFDTLGALAGFQSPATGLLLRAGCGGGRAAGALWPLLEPR